MQALLIVSLAAALVAATPQFCDSTRGRPCQMLAGPTVNTFAPSTTSFDEPGIFYALNALDMQVLVNVVSKSTGQNAVLAVDEVTFVCDPSHPGSSDYHYESFRVEDFDGFFEKLLRCSAGSCNTATGSECSLDVILREDPVPQVSIKSLYYGGSQALEGGICFQGMTCPREKSSTLPPSTGLTNSVTPTSVASSSDYSLAPFLAPNNQQYCRVNIGYPCQILADPWIHTFKPSTIYFIELGLFYALNSEELQVLVNVVKDIDVAGLTVYVANEVIYICDPHNPGSASYHKESITVESLAVVREKKFTCEVGTCKRGGQGCSMTVLLHMDPIPNVSMTNLFYGGSKNFAAES
ncbi:hypothetical protein HDU98_009749 [Podochytrium sp. JEL0797]|nr:hypothetical protein HDU98_009749 [Podochytrium sp. JEL0797]